MAPQNSAELYMKARTQLDIAASSMSNGPTQQTIDVLLSLTTTIAKLLYVATTEVAAKEQHEFVRTLHTLKIEDLK